MRIVRLLPLFLLVISCAGGSFRASTGDSDKSGAVLLSTGSNSASTEDFDVNLVQSNTSMMTYSETDTDIKFDITVTNKSKEPYTIRRIALRSIGGESFSIPVTTRAYTKTIAPGQNAMFPYWTKAYVNDQTSKQPVTMHTWIEAVSASGNKRSEEFTSQINGRLQVQVDKGGRPPR